MGRPIVEERARQLATWFMRRVLFIRKFRDNYYQSRKAILFLQCQFRSRLEMKALRMQGLQEIWKHEQGILLDRFVKNKRQILLDKSFTKQVF